MLGSWREERRGLWIGRCMGSQGQCLRTIGLTCCLNRLSGAAYVPMYYRETSCRTARLWLRLQFHLAGAR